MIINKKNTYKNKTNFLYDFAYVLRCIFGPKTAQKWFKWRI